MASGNFFKHWPTMLLGLIVAVVLLTAVFSFQLNQTEVAVVTTFGRPAVVDAPGLHFRWPFPFQEVYRFDKRIRCYEGSSGKLEETSTKDAHNIIAGIYVNYRIKDAEAFFKQLQDIPNAESVLNDRMRSVKNATFGEFEFAQIINTRTEMLKINEIQQQIQQKLADQLAPFGIEVVGVGINSLGVPPSITEQVYDRMIAERKKLATQEISQGQAEAKKIRIEAETYRDKKLAEAEAQALRIRAEGDAAAVKSYEVFARNPELAEFIRKMEALRTIIRGKTTIIFNTDTPPFDLLKPNAAELVPGNKK